MPTIKQKRAVKKIVENRGNVSKAMLEAGYPPTTAKNPKNLTDSKGFKELMEENLSNDKLLKKHEQLLNSTKIEHMIFPLGPKDEDDPNLSGANPNDEEGSDADGEPESTMPEEYRERTTLTDKEIIEMLSEVNCKVRRIVHGQTARHVYFWASDNKALKDALDMGYKLKGSYAPEKSQALNLNIDARLEANPEIEALNKEYEEKMRQIYVKGRN